MKPSARSLWTKLLGIVVVSFFVMEPARACPVCYGVTDASTIAGVNFAILALLGVTGSVLAGFASFFLYIRKRSRMMLDGSHYSASKN
jgi:hypothetical protein